MVDYRKKEERRGKEKTMIKKKKDGALNRRLTKIESKKRQ